MLSSATAVLSLFAAAAMASTIPASLAARIPEGVSYTVVAPEEIPEYIKTATAGVANATDIEARGEGLAKRANHGVYLCTNANWGGHCVHIVAGAGVCGK